MRMATIFHKIIGYLNSKHYFGARADDQKTGTYRAAGVFNSDYTNP